MIWPSYLSREIAQLAAEGKTQLPCPYRGRDEDFAGGLIWSGFSDGSLIERARQEVTNALQIYVELTVCWFKKISDRLDLFKTLPLRYVGRVKTDENHGPQVSYYTVCLPPGSPNVVDVQVTEDDVWNATDVFGEQQEAAKQWRADCIECVSLTQGTSVMHSIFAATPGALMAYGWLCRDLKKLAWLDEDLRFN